LTEVAGTPPAFSAALSSQYRVERELGRGGMATVYLAEDLRHQRRVAIKVVHPDLAAAIGGDRFLTEIRTTATLQHPHILGLIDSGNADGVLYYVMPFVEGETLRARLAREGQLPVDDAVRIATDVASALDYAHRHGVVHRDIKPENILLQDGSALVADFGIALALSTAGGERLTQTGVSLGTPQYMAPEQAMAERIIDARADVYALGAVTYEMLIGEAPFTGPTVQAVITRAMTERPRTLSTQRPSVPSWVEAAVLKSLERLPADRQRSASEFAQALATPTARPQQPVAARARRSAIVALATVAAVGATAIGLIIGQRIERRRLPTYPPSRLSLVTPRLAGFGQISLQRQIAITPDGTTLLYVALGEDGYGHVVRQSLTDLQPAPISGVRRWITAPTVSPDGQSFFGMANGERLAYRYPVSGGSGEPLSLVGGYTDFTQWDDRGTIWYSPSNGGGLLRLNPGDTTAHFVPHSEGLRMQQVLPDERHVLVMTQATTQSGPAAIFDVQTGEKVPLLATAVQEIRYAAGFLVYALPNGVLEAVPFDAARGQVTGRATVIGNDVSITGAGVAQFAVSRTGTVAYIVEDLPSLVFVDHDGKARTALDALHNYHAPRFSPDGRHLAVDFNTESGRDVWVLSTADGTLSRLSLVGDGHDPTWTPDGRFITYLSAKSGTERIFKIRWNGSESPDSLFASPQIGYTGVWLRDASGLVTVINDLRPHSGADVALVQNAGRGPAKPLAASEFTESFPTVSPDGRWFAFASDQSGHLEVYVRPIDGDGDQLQISTNGGTEPAWAPDGRTIYYRSVGDRDPQLVAATLSATPPFTVVSRRTLFSVVDMVGANPHVSYDVSPDGRTFAMVRRTPPSRIMVVQNVPGLMKR
jgi:serine/threonine-protein kinase